MKKVALFPGSFDPFPFVLGEAAGFIEPIGVATDDIDGDGSVDAVASAVGMPGVLSALPVEKSPCRSSVIATMAPS